MILESNVSRLVQLVAAVAFGISLSCVKAQAAHFTTLYRFTNGTDGETPYGGVTRDAAGVLYGTTASGGDPSCHKDCSDFGTVYSFSPANGLKTLVYFTGSNGGGPLNTLLLKGSTLYGASGGGASNDGVIFSVHTDGTSFTLLHQFTGADGMMPQGTPRLGPAGVFVWHHLRRRLYGNGVLFSISPNGTYTILHAFTGGADGGTPTSLLISSAGELVGSTYYGGADTTCLPPDGCGIVFTYLPATAKYTVAYTFPTVQSAEPMLGSIGPGPTVYGTTAYITLNTIFSLGPAGLKTVATLTGGVSGQQYPGPTLAPDGSLLLTVGPGPYGGEGSLDDIKGGKLISSIGFDGGAMGGAPAGQPLVTPNGTVFGTTAFDGACSECGTIYEVTP